MKKNIILYVAITILLCALTGLATYVILDKKDNKTEIKENDNKLTEKEEEKITLSDSELEKYMGYIPDQIKVDEYYNTDTIYSRKLTTIKDVKNSDLLGKVLYTLGGDKDEEEIVASYDATNKKMQEMYNTPLEKYADSYDENGNWKNYAAVYEGCGFTYINGNFIMNYYASGWEMVSIIDNYEATDKELIIYSYHAGIDNDLVSTIKIYDEYKQKTITTLNYDYDNIYQETIDYTKNHKQEFTKYKHTFKKNETGYYWYSTEVA